MEAKQQQAWAAIVAEMKRRVEEDGRGAVVAIGKALGIPRGTISKYISGELKGKISYIKTREMMLGLGLDPTPYFDSNEDLANRVKSLEQENAMLTKELAEARREIIEAKDELLKIYRESDMGRSRNSGRAEIDVPTSSARSQQGTSGKS